MPESFTCPVCGATSYNPNDVANGYCGACHDFTGTCRYFLLCEKAAEGYVEVPVLGKVPTCRRCARHIGAELVTVTRCEHGTVQSETVRCRACNRVGARR